MTEVIKLAAVGIICAVLCVIIRQYRPELAPFAQLAGIVVIGVTALQFVKAVLGMTAELVDGFGVIDVQYLELMIKILGIAVLTKIGADICTDSGSTSLATAVGLAGKVIILAMCFPLIKAVAQLAGGFLD